MNFSFAGCGFLGIYHVGVAACLKKYAPNLLVNKISGASAGALAAVFLLCDSPLGIITTSVLKTATEARRRMLGPFSPTFNVEKLLKEGLLSVLPDDAHKIVSGKLFISVTRVSDGKNILLSQFDTREELVQACICSAFIPGFSGWASPTVRGVRYIDGGFTDNLPEVDIHTVTVSPFGGEADICPKDNTAGLITVSLANTSIELSKENLYRFARILFPPRPEVLNKMCQQGFNDALDFLQRNNLINCMRCLSVTSKFKIPNAHEEEVHIGIDDELNCIDCHKQRKEAIIDQLPEQVGSILQDAIDKANQGLMNWVFKHKSMKLLSIITLPCVLPIDIAYAAFLKFTGSSPSTNDIKVLGKQIVNLIQELIHSVTQSGGHHHHKDKFSCQLAITEFSGENEAQQVNRRHDFDFTLDMEDVGVPHNHKEAMLLQSEALTQVALRCASRCVSRAGSRVASRAASRSVSRAVSRMPSLDDLTDPNLFEGPGHITDDAFDQILDVTTHQEALMAYYYLDDNNEVQVTEIFDMTNDGDNLGHCDLVDESHRLNVMDTDMSRWPLSRSVSIDSVAENCEAVCGSPPSDTESENFQRCDNEPESEQNFPVSPSQLKMNLRKHFRAALP